MNTEVKKKRFFKVYTAKKVDGTTDKYELLPHEKLRIDNRYKGTNAYIAARKVLKQIGEDKASFVLKETTRDSSKKLYFYDGEKKPLEKPREETLTNKKTNVTRKITVTHFMEPQSVPPEKLGHSNPLTDWKIKKKNVGKMFVSQTNSSVSQITSACAI